MRFDNVLKRMLFKPQNNISPFAVVDNNVEVDPTAMVYHFVVLRDNVKIGADSIIGHLVLIERDTHIGKNTTIQSQCHITANARIGDNVFFGPSVVTMNEKKIANQGRAEPKIERLEIGDGARIGAGAILAPGVKIGKNAFVKAGSFVVYDIPEGQIYGCRNGFYKAVHCGEVPREEWL